MGSVRGSNGTTRVPKARRPVPQNRHDNATVIDVQVSSPADGVRVLRVVGDIDMLTAPVLDSMVAGQLQGTHGTVVLDLREVGFMSSAGLASLVSAKDKASATGVTLRVVCSSEPVLRPLAITGMAILFDLYDDLNAAVT